MSIIILKKISIKNDIYVLSEKNLLKQILLYTFCWIYFLMHFSKYTLTLKNPQGLSVHPISFLSKECLDFKNVSRFWPAYKMNPDRQNSFLYYKDFWLFDSWSSKCFNVYCMLSQKSNSSYIFVRKLLFNLGLKPNIQHSER